MAAGSASQNHAVTGNIIADPMRTSDIQRMIDSRRRIQWIPGPRPHSLRASGEIQPHGWGADISEADMDPVQAWCDQHDCGRRLSFDIFQFRDPHEITLFLLRWS